MPCDVDQPLVLIALCGDGIVAGEVHLTQVVL